MESTQILILMTALIIAGSIGAKALTLGKYDPARHTGNPRIDAVKERIGRYHGGCSVCGGTSFELGRLQGDKMIRFMPYGKAFIGGKYTVALCCDDCGQVMLFRIDQERASDLKRGTKSVTVG